MYPTRINKILFINYYVIYEDFHVYIVKVNLRSQDPSGQLRLSIIKFILWFNKIIS